MRVVVINGPNLNLLGTRQPDVYGSETLTDLEARVRGWASGLGADVDFFQSNDEGPLVDAIQAADGADGIIINPGAFTHTSRAIADAVASIESPVVEVHISNIMERESWRRVSVLDGAVARTIFGRGIAGYRDALRLVANLESPRTVIRYGPHPENVADLRDTKEAALLVVLVHGGFWLREYGRDTTETLAVDLAKRGHATANLEYRRSEAGGAWPGSGHDVKMAIDYLTANTPHRQMVLMGHSAGGYLCLWASSMTRPALTIGLGAVTDLTAIASTPGPGQTQTASMLAAGAPAAVGGSGRVALFHGADDQLVASSQSSQVSDAEVSVIDGLGHFELLDPSREHWPAVVTVVDSVLASF